jgi:hypothetical protein
MMAAVARATTMTARILGWPRSTIAEDQGRDDEVEVKRGGQLLASEGPRRGGWLWLVGGPSG